MVRLTHDERVQKFFPFGRADIAGDFSGDKNGIDALQLLRIVYLQNPAPLVAIIHRKRSEVSNRVGDGFLLRPGLKRILRGAQLSARQVEGVENEGLSLRVKDPPTRFRGISSAIGIVYI